VLSALLIDVAILAATGLVVWITFGLLGPTWGIGYLMLCAVDCRLVCGPVLHKAPQRTWRYWPDADR